MARKTLLNEIDMQFQIDHMVAFIDQEAREKIYEIEGKTEEEYNIEKGNLIQKERLKIKEYYQRQEDNVILNKGISDYSLLNKARLDILKFRDNQFNGLLTTATEQMLDDIKNVEDYKPILNKLLLQGMLKALESRIVVRCLERDVEILQECFSDAATKYKEFTGKDITMAIDVDHFLLEDEIGGVEITSLDGTIKVLTTLRSRVEKIFQELLPEIRQALLGPNRNRKFME